MLTVDTLGKDYHALSWAHIINRTLPELEVLMDVQCAVLEMHIPLTAAYRYAQINIQRIETVMLNLYQTTQGEFHETAL